jgi:hypothetical protein
MGAKNLKAIENFLPSPNRTTRAGATVSTTGA